MILSEPHHDPTRGRTSNAASRYRYYVSRVHLEPFGGTYHVHGHYSVGAAVEDVYGYGRQFADNYLDDFGQSLWYEYIRVFEDYYPYPRHDDRYLEDVIQAVNGFFHKFE